MLPKITGCGGLLEFFNRIANKVVVGATTNDCRNLSFVQPPNFSFAFKLRDYSARCWCAQCGGGHGEAILYTLFKGVAASHADPVIVRSYQHVDKHQIGERDTADDER